MALKFRDVALIAALSGTALPATAAQAQWYDSYSVRQPANPYGAQAYAIEVAPNTYVIRRPVAPRHKPRAIKGPQRHRAPTARSVHRAAPKPESKSASTPASKRARKPVQTGKVERQRVGEAVPSGRGLFQGGRSVEITLPPPPPARAATDRPDEKSRAQRESDEPRVIHADAEITILGPDRMTIRLIRKDDKATDALVR
jgi:hypothetical protein